VEVVDHTFPWGPHKLPVTIRRQVTHGGPVNEPVPLWTLIYFKPAVAKQRCEKVVQEHFEPIEDEL